MKKAATDKATQPNAFTFCTTNYITWPYIMLHYIAEPSISGAQKKSRVDGKPQFLISVSTTHITKNQQLATISGIPIYIG